MNNKLYTDAENVFLFNFKAQNLEFLKITLSILKLLGLKQLIFFHDSCPSHFYISANFYQNCKPLTPIDGKFYADVKNGVVFEF